MDEKLIEKIKSRGYWRVNFQPFTANDKLKLSECKDLVKKNDVALRGWNFPHFPMKRDQSSGIEPCTGYYQGWTEWGSHKEFWRMYKTGQFLSYRAFNEDWFEEDGWHQELAEQIKPFTSLSVVGSVIFVVTEIIEFLRRLTSEKIYDDGVIIKITLFNTKDKTFKRLGVSSEHMKTYVIDIMKDQMTKYADPHVQFEVKFVKDRDGLYFVLIHVLPFRDIPVICRCDDPKAGTKKGTLYYRNSNRRPESAPISNSYDMRDVIEMASYRMMQQKTKLGLTTAEPGNNTQNRQILEDELEGL